MSKISPVPPNSLNDAIDSILKSWKQDSLVENPFRHLYLLRHLRQRSTTELVQGIKQTIVDAIGHVALRYPHEAELLRRHYLNHELIHVLAHDKDVSDSTVFRNLSEGRKLVTQRIQYLEEQAKLQFLAEISKRLEPPTYSHLIGLERAIKQLSTLLCTQNAPWIVSIEGIGGIGKTALADALARRLIEDGLVYDLAWVTARQTVFNLGFANTNRAKPALTSDALMDALYTQLIGPRPSTFTAKEVVAALTRLLKAQPYLLFIDNLETVADIDALLPTLRGLVDPTHIVLTTRHSLFGQSDIYLFAQGELSKTDSLLLFRHEAATHHLPEVAQTDDSALMPLVERTGGNPLAIKLTVGLLHIHSLDEIVADLISRRSDEVNRLYDFIYLRSWESLNEKERNTLLAMPLIDELGGTLDELAGVSRMAHDDIHKAIERLVRLNLVNRRGSLHESHYTIHGLTRSFLHRQIVEWEE